MLPENLIIRELEKAQRKPARVSHILVLDQDLDRFCQANIESLDSLSKTFSQDADLFDDLCWWAEERVEERERVKTMNMVELWQQKAANRSLYVPQPRLTAYDFKAQGWDEPHPRLKSKDPVQCAGLLHQMVEYLHRQQVSPVAVYFEDNTRERKALVPEVKIALRKLGLRSSKGRLFWNTQNVAWQYVCRTFPVAIDLLAYGHSLMSPLIPHGFVPQCPVTFRRLKDSEGRDLGVDGSGLYHPAAPQMAALMAQYGAVSFQFRYIHTNGTFAKGMLFPSELAVDENNNPTVVLDWLQVKGLHKETFEDYEENGEKKRRLVRGAKLRYQEDAVLTQDGNGFLGILRVRTRATTLASCFEILENIKVTDRTKKIITMQVQRALARMLKRGPTDLLRKVEAKDQNIVHMVRVCRVLQEQGEKISPLQVDRIKNAVKEALGRELWRIAQGGGLHFRAHDARLDATLEPGTCVISGFPGGVKVAAIRLPTVLSQGLVTMTTTEPKAHHLYCGSMPPGIVVMHPQDLVLKMQGDDDGDTIGISSDREVLELFANLVDNRLYKIESDSKRLEARTDSVEGEQLMERSQRGEVDRLTIMRSRLLAVGDIAGANALSISIQEAVDRAKKIVQYSDFRKAANLGNWDLGDDGVYRFHHLLGEDVTPVGVFPIELAQRWVAQRLKAHGCHRMDDQGNVVAGNPLTWRPPGGLKTINPDNWGPTTSSSYHGGNLVHIAHDAAWQYWHEHAAGFQLEAEPVNMEVLLYKALLGVGTNVAVPNLDEWAYQELYRRSGLRAYNDKLAVVLKDYQDKNERIHQINMEQQHLENQLKTLNMSELLTIWHNQCQENKLNDALKAVCWEGSPVMQALGLQDAAQCTFMTQKRLDVAVATALSDELPHRRMQELILKSEAHQKTTERRDQDGNIIEAGVPLARCPVCLDRLQDSLVHNIRYRDGFDRSEFLARIVQAVNSAMDFLDFGGQTRS